MNKQSLNSNIKSSYVLSVLKALSFVFFILMFSPSQILAKTLCTMDPSNNYTGAYGNSINILNGTEVKSTSSFKVNCTLDASATKVMLCVQFPANSATSTTRVMTNGINTLTHELYMDPTYQNVWGSWQVPTYGAGKGSGYSFTLTGISGQTVSQTFTVYGKILSSQTNTRPATYTWSLPSAPVIYYTQTASCDPVPADATAINNSNTTSWTATIAAGCYISGSNATTSGIINPSTSGNINFSPNGPISTIPVGGISQSGNMYTQCTNGTSYIIGMGNGNNFAVDIDKNSYRHLKNGNNTIPYGLYKDINYTQPWANVASGVCAVINGCVTGTGTGNPVPFPIYAKILNLTGVAFTSAVGTYTDTVVVTIAY